MFSHGSALPSALLEFGSHVEERKHKNSGAAPDKEMNDEKSSFQRKARSLTVRQLSSDKNLSELSNE